MSVRAADGVAVVSDGDVVYLALVPRGRPVALSGSASIIWTALPGTREEVAARVAHHYDVAPDDVRADVDAFLDHLIADGLATEQADG